MTTTTTTPTNPFIPFFPTTQKIKSPRAVQLEVFNQLWQLLPTTRKIIIAAPTGSGKSIIGYTFLRYAQHTGERGLYTSPLNVLVEQLKNEFNIPTLKGRKNYPCVSRGSPFTAEEGYCQSDQCSLDINEPRTCREEKYKSDIDIDIDNGNDNKTKKDCTMCKCRHCIYLSELLTFKRAPIANTNFTLFEIGLHNEPYTVIIDESDDIETFIRMHHTVTIYEDWGSQSWQDHLILLEDYRDQLHTDHAKATGIHKIKIERKLSKVNYLLSDYARYKEPWCVTISAYNGKPKITYEPITINRFLEPLTKNRIMVLMSATPQRLPDYQLIEVDSEFPPDIRPWLWYPLGRMSYRYREKTIPKVAEFVAGLRGKTVVHCGSYMTAENIYRALERYADHNGLDDNDNVAGRTYLQRPDSYPECMDDILDDKVNVRRKDIVQLFKECRQPNQILLSVKLERGVDFYEPEIVNNVIAVVPWPNPNEPLTKAKNEYLGTGWQDEEVARALMQSYGRVVRGTHKRTTTYYIDSNFNNPALGRWFTSHKHLFYKWFLEAEVQQLPRPQVNQPLLHT